MRFLGGTGFTLCVSALHMGRTLVSATSYMRCYSYTKQSLKRDLYIPKFEKHDIYMRGGTQGWEALA